MIKPNITHALIFCALFAFSVGEVFADQPLRQAATEAQAEIRDISQSQAREEALPSEPQGESSQSSSTSSWTIDDGFHQIVPAIRNANQRATNLKNLSGARLSGSSTFKRFIRPNSPEFDTLREAEQETYRQQWNLLTPREKTALRDFTLTPPEGVDSAFFNRGTARMQQLCCGDENISCSPTPHCLNNVLEDDEYKLLTGCRSGWFGTENSSCEEHKKALREKRDAIMGIQRQVAQRATKAKEQADKMKSDIQSFVDGQDDPFNTAALAGRMALLKVSQGTTAAQIRGSATGAKILDYIKESYLGKYLDRRLNFFFDYGSVRESFSELQQLCSAARESLCPALTDGAVNGVRQLNDYEQEVIKESYDGTGPAGPASRR